jgi:hypothetical protein
MRTILLLSVFALLGFGGLAGAADSGKGGVNAAAYGAATIRGGSGSSTNRPTGGGGFEARSPTGGGGFALDTKSGSDRANLITTTAQ